MTKLVVGHVVACALERYGLDVASGREKKRARSSVRDRIVERLQGRRQIQREFQARGLADLEAMFVADAGMLLLGAELPARPASDEDVEAAKSSTSTTWNEQ